MYGKKQIKQAAIPDTLGARSRDVVLIHTASNKAQPYATGIMDMEECTVHYCHYHTNLGVATEEFERRVKIRQATVYNVGERRPV